MLPGNVVTALLVLSPDAVTVDVHRKYANNVALAQGNRFRVGFHTGASGLRFFKVNCDSQATSPFRASLKQTVPNSIMVMRCDDQADSAAQTGGIDYKRRMMEAALSVSECVPGDGNGACPLWAPPNGLTLLDCYLAAHKNADTPLEQCHDRAVFQRIIRLCHALWSDIGESGKALPPFLHDLARKQLFSQWIRYASICLYCMPPLRLRVLMY